MYRFSTINLCLENEFKISPMGLIGSRSEVVSNVYAKFRQAPIFFDDSPRFRIVFQRPRLNFRNGGARTWNACVFAGERISVQHTSRQLFVEK